MDYLVMWYLWCYFAIVTLDGNTKNEFLGELPAELQECVLTIGKHIAELLF